MPQPTVSSPHKHLFGLPFSGSYILSSILPMYSYGHMKQTPDTGRGALTKGTKCRPQHTHTQRLFLYPVLDECPRSQAYQFQVSTTVPLSKTVPSHPPTHPIHTRPHNSLQLYTTLPPVPFVLAVPSLSQLVPRPAESYRPTIRRRNSLTPSTLIVTFFSDRNYTMLIFPRSSALGAEMWISIYWCTPSHPSQHSFLSSLLYTLVGKCSSLSSSTK